MSLSTGRTTGFVTGSNQLFNSQQQQQQAYVMTHGLRRRQPAAPRYAVGQKHGQDFPEGSAGIVASCEGILSNPLYNLPDEATPNGRAIEVKQCEQRENYLPKLVPVEDGDLVHKLHHFSERANWLVPGKILLGKYPGQIPVDLQKEPDLQLARDRVLDIVLRGGATDLFCLQAELPPQDAESRWDPPSDEHDNGSFFSGFRAYRGDALAAVAERDGAGAVGAAGEVGVGVEVGAIPMEERLAFHHFPIPDLSPAESTKILSGLVDQIEALVAAGRVPFIHCWAGRGRTGLIASCLLGRLYPELSADQALTRVDAYYRTRGTVAIGKTCRVSPETPEQEEQVRTFFKQELKRS